MMTAEQRVSDCSEEEEGRMGRRRGERGYGDWRTGEAGWTENALSTAVAQQSSRSRSLSHWRMNERSRGGVRREIERR